MPIAERVAHDKKANDHDTQVVHYFVLQPSFFKIAVLH